MDGYVKVYFRNKSYNPSEITIKYCKESDNGSLRIFRENIVSVFPELKEIEWKMYWIDDEDDEIEIKEDESYLCFQAAMKGKKKKIYVDDAKSNTNLPEAAAAGVFVPTSDRSPKSDGMSDSKKKHHPGVVCDACDSSIFGFRYKCVQCPDFDLCGTCEGEMLHNEHVMFRIPIPLDKIAFDRRTLKKMKRGHFLCTETAQDAERGTSRDPNSRGNRRYCRRNYITNLYTMMHDLAEGTYGPVEFDTDKKCGKKNKADKPSATENCSPQSSSTTPLNYNTCSSQQFMNPKYYTQAGIQMLENFGQMFEKFLVPVIDIAAKTNASDPTDQSKSDETDLPKTASNSYEEKKDETKNCEEKVEGNNLREAPKSPVDGESNSDKLNGDVVVKERRNSNEACGWTLVDKVAEEQSGSSNGKPVLPSAPSAINEDSTLPEPNYVSLSKDLWKQVQSEETKAPVETRAQIVYHCKPHINNAIIAMSAMGFSNEGNWLTGLLESVDGDIPKALDLLQPGK